MILIQLILSIGIFVIVGRFLISPNSLQTRAWKKLTLLLMGVAAVVFILFPTLLDQIAHSVGVGRGADLLLYVLVMAFIFGQFNHYIKAQEDDRRIIALSRKLAIAEALREKEKRG